MRSSAVKPAVMACSVASKSPEVAERICPDRLAVFRHGERCLLCVLQHRLILLKNRPLHLLRVLRYAVQPVIRKTRARAKHQQHTKRNDQSFFHMFFFSASLSSAGFPGSYLP